MCILCFNIKINKRLYGAHSYISLYWQIYVISLYNMYISYDKTFEGHIHFDF